LTIPAGTVQVPEEVKTAILEGPAAAMEVMVTPPVDPVREMPAPAVTLVTPELVKVTAPVAPLTPIPVPATALVTPVFATVTAPVEALTLTPEPAVRLVTPAAAATKSLMLEFHATSEMPAATTVTPVVGEVGPPLMTTLLFELLMTT
jgi:hypothetical protein